MKKKRCTKCLEVKKLNEFHKGDGKYDRKSWCKICRSKRHKGEVIEVDNNKANSVKKLIAKIRADRYNKYQNEYYHTVDKDKSIVRGVLNTNIDRGKFPYASTKKCVDCNKQAEEYHHLSYNLDNVYDVVALCKNCHVQRHRKE